MALFNSRIAPVAVLSLTLGLGGCGDVSVNDISLPDVSLPDFEFLDGLGSQSASSISSLEGGAELLVNNSLTGEQCRVRKLGDVEGAAIEDFAVNCGGWTEASGRIRRFFSEKVTSLEPLLTTPELSLWAPATAECGAVQTTTGPNGTSILVRECTKSDGWPMLAWAARANIDDKPGIYVGYGLPHIVPVVDALLSGLDVKIVQTGSNSGLALLAERQIAGNNGTIRLDDIMNFRHLMQIGLAFNQAGDFAHAVQAYERGLDIKRERQGGQDSFTAPVLAALGLNLASDNRATEAEIAFEEAARLAEQLRSTDAFPTYLAYRSAFVRRFGKLEEASNLAKQATELRIGMFGAENSSVAAGLLLQAGIAIDGSDLSLARNFLRRAETIFAQASEPVSLAFTYAARARLERLDGHPEEARDQGLLSAELIEDLFGDGRNLAEVAIELGAAEAELGNVNEALEWFDKGLQAAESARLERSYLRPDQLEPLLAVLFSSAKEGGSGADVYARAVRAMQAPRGATFEKSLRRMTARLAADNSELQLVVRQLEDAKEREREARIARGRLRLNDPTSAAGRTEKELGVLVQAAADEASRLEQRLQVQHPRYGALIVPKVLDQNGITGLLRQNEAVLRITSTGKASYAVLARGDGEIMGHRSLVNIEQLGEQIRYLREPLTFAKGLQPFDVAGAHGLFSALFGPLDFSGIRHLVVVADGPLTSLPLEVLPVRPSRGSEYSEIAWLGRDTALSYLPSMASLDAFRTAVQASRASEPFLGIGNPRLGGKGSGEVAARAALDACQNGNTYDPALLNAMVSLPETEDELRSIAKTLGASGDDLRFGRNATETVVKDLDLRKYRVISFATHGLLPGEFRCQGEPGLVLTPPRKASGEDDGLLAASEIARLELDAELVVLSACNTAGPDGTLGGEALSGLATAFTYAGARRLMVSHWDVASDATVALMQRSFSTMESGTAEALLEARRSLIANPKQAHPAFWAPFVLIGDGGAPATL